MSKEMKVYHVETQEDYDDLMIELENEGYKWINGNKPTSQNYWGWFKSETIVLLNEIVKHTMTYDFLGSAKKKCIDITIIKYKAKVEQMGKVIVPKFVADWYEVWNTGFLGNKIAELEHASGRMEQWIDSLETDDRYGMEIAQEVIAKMHMYDYEVEETDKWTYDESKNKIGDDVELFTPVEELNE